MVSLVSVNKLAELDLQGGVDVIDVRTPVEFAGVRAAMARNVPLESLDPGAVMKDRNGSAGEPLYVICQSGARGAKACQAFIDAGYTDVINVEGGTSAWDAAGLPVVRSNKSVMSLERQVRLTVGVVVLISTFLAIMVHPYFAGVAAAMGAGLTFAAITDSCALGMVLAKMPWNQVTPSCCSND